MVNLERQYIVALGRYAVSLRVESGDNRVSPLSKVGRPMLGTS